MTTASAPRDPWDDERLRAAFAARASRASAADLATTTITALRARPARQPVWRRMLARAAAAAVIVIGVTSGFAMLLNGDRGASGLFRDGPKPDLKTFDSGEFAFEYPADWLGYDTTVAFSGGSSIAVLGTQPVESRCGDERHVDVNCVYEQPLEPGDIRVFVGTGAFRGGTVLDPPDIENGTTTRHTVAGMPAVLDEYDPQPDSFYREDLSLSWSIGRPGLLSNVIRIELRAREPVGRRPRSVVAEVRAALDSLIASFRFDAAALASPADPWAGKTAVGLPTISVSDAIAIRDTGVVDREIAVHGWFHPIPPTSCPAPLEPPTSPVQPVCPDQFVWLTEESESLTIVEPNGMTGRPAASPAIHPDMDLVDRRWFPRLPAQGLAIPVEVVFVGHFDDRRSVACPQDEEVACRDRFVVDRVDWVNGETQPLSVIDELDHRPFLTVDEVVEIVEGEAPGSAVLSIVAVNGTTGIESVEPTLGQGFDGTTEEIAIWVVRVLESERLSTYLVIDGEDRIYKVDANGAPVLVDGERPALTTPSASAAEPTPLEPATLTLELTGDDRPIPFDVLDRTDLLVDAREATSDERSQPWDGAMAIQNLAPDTILVRWTGSVCDRHPRLTIEEADGRPEALRLTDVRPGCDLIPISRGVVLRFSIGVDAGDLTGAAFVTLTD
jgi:hypothetical protein